MEILIPILILVAIAAVCAVLLTVADKYFGVPTDEKEARATMDAATRVMGTPRKHLGAGQFSILPRTPANSTIASKKPRPTPSEEIIDSMKL